MIGKQLHSIIPLGSTSSSGIIGEELASPHAAVAFGDAGYLTTGTLAVGESGDGSYLGEFTVECWVRVEAAYPAATINLVKGPDGGGGAGQYRLQLTSSGQLLTVMRTGPTGGNTYTASDPHSLALNRWYYVVATVTGGVLRLYKDAVQVGSDSGVGGEMPVIDANQDMRIGDASMVDTNLFFQHVAFYRSGLDFDRVVAHYQAGVDRGFPEQLVGTRINAVLDDSNSVAARSIQAGTRTLSPRYMVAQPPLDEIRSAGTAEAPNALFFADRNGTLTFLDNEHRTAPPYDTAQATFDDDGTDLPYLDAKVDYSESFLLNEVNITRRGFDAVTQTATDTTSLNEFYKRSFSATDVPVTNDTDAGDIADALVAKYKDPFTRVTSLELDTSVDTVTVAAFSLDLGDKIRVFRTQPGGSRIDQSSFVQKISVSGDNSGAPWRISLGVSPL